MRHWLFILLIAFLTHNLHSATIIWTGNTSTLWSEKTNWDLGRSPIVGDDVVIVAGSNNSVVDKDFQNLNSVIIQSNGHLTVGVGNELTVSGNSTRAIQILSSSNLVVNGGLGIFNHTGNGMHLASGTLTNNDQIIISGINAGSGGTGIGFYNEGTVNNNDDIEIQNTDDLGWENITTLHNNGIIDIKNLNNTANGMYNEGTINNNGGDKIIINNVPGSRGLDNQGAFNNIGTVDIKNLPNGVGLFNDDTFTNTNVVSVTNVLNYGIENTRTFNHNNGSITISKIQNNGLAAQDIAGIRTTNSFITSTTASISINTIINFGFQIAHGIENSATFTCSGAVTIDSIVGFTAYGILNSGNYSLNDNNTNISRVHGTVMAHGIQATGNLTVQSNGNLVIGSIINTNGGGTSYGIQNSATFSCSGNLTIDSISAHTPYGLFNSGVCNINTTNISRVQGFLSAFGIQNSGDLTVNSNGTLLIDNTVVSSISTFAKAFGISNTTSGATFTNMGSMSIKDSEHFGLRNEGIFNNSDSLLIIGFESKGIESDSIFNNQIGSYIALNSNGFLGTIGIDNDHIFNNDGKIIGEDFTKGYQGAFLTNTKSMIFTDAPMVIDSQLINSGEVHIINSLSGITNKKTIQNLANGSIVIDSTTFNDGLINAVGSTLINLGNIEIKKCSNISINNLGNIVNSDTIIIDSIAHRDELFNGVGSSFSNEVNAMLFIHNNTSSIGQAIDNMASFNNAGFIDIFKANSFTILNTGTWINSGILKVDSLDTSPSTLRPALSNSFSGSFNNSGTLDINTGYINNSGAPLTNSGLITINSHFGVAIDNNDSIFNTSTGIINIGDQIQANLQNKGTINLTASGFFINENIITIGVVEGTAVNNGGTFLNQKSLDILKARIGIKNDNFLTNEIGARIKVDTLSKFGNNVESWLLDLLGGSAPFTNRGLLQADSCNHGGLKINTTFENFGNIILSNLPGRAIHATDSLFNRPTGTITINNISSIFNQGLFTSEYLKNEGSITFNECLATAIINSGTIDNHGSMSFDSVHRTSIFSSGIFNNKSTALITITNNVNNGSVSLFNSGSFVNDNIINIINVAGTSVDSRGYFENNKTINIRNVGAGITTSDTLINNALAKIDIRFVNTSNGILNKDDGGVPANDAKTVINHGTIKILEVTDDDAIDNIGTFENHGIIDIDDCRGAFKSGIFNQGKFYNKANASIDIFETTMGIHTRDFLRNDGDIDIERASSEGIFNTDSLINNKVITLDSIGGIGLFSEVSAAGLLIFNNNATGNIDINNAEDGLNISGQIATSSIGKLTNKGKINITNSRQKGVEVGVLGIFDNMDTLLIDNAFTGLYNNNQFNNLSGGYINVKNIHGNGAFGFSIYNRKDMNNASCAKIVFEGGLKNLRNFNNPAHFDNNGIILQNSTMANEIIDTINNNGIYAGPSGATVDVGKFKNVGMYTSPIIGTFKCNNVIDFYNGLGTGITGTMITTDFAGNTSAGSMNIPAGTISLNSTIDNVDTLYAHLTQGGCSVVIPIPFATTITCGGCGVNTFTGLATNGWNNPSNWSLGMIPDNCHEVIIPTGKTCVLGLGMSGECSLIEIAIGASFEVSGVLDVFGN